MSVMYPDERINGEPVRMYECRGMLDACQDLGLTDVPFTSDNKFTWTNGTIWSRIDRIFVNPDWLDQEMYCRASFPNKWQFSDHKPAIAHLIRRPRAGKPHFKFFNMWTAHEQFQEIVEEN